MSAPPERVDGAEGPWLSTLLIGRRIDCDQCSYRGKPERVQFPLADCEGIYCPECGGLLCRSDSETAAVTND